MNTINPLTPTVAIRVQL